MSKTFTVSFISEARFFAAGTPVPDDCIRPFMRKWEAQEEREPKPNEINIRRKWNQPYSVDADGFMMEPVGGQMARMEASNREQELAEDEMSEPPNDTVASALEQAREDYRADVDGQIADAQIRAERDDAFSEAIREEQDSKVESGEFDHYDSPQEESKPKEKVYRVSSKSFVKRDGRFVTSNSVELIDGEKLFRFRKRSFGIAQKLIAFSTVKKSKESNNE